MPKPYVLLSQGKVEEESGVAVLNLDLLLENPATTRPTKVEALKDQLEEIKAAEDADWHSIGRWISVCDAWLGDYREINGE